jgi:hypothetical protein
MPLAPETFGVLIPFGAFIMVIIIVWVASQEKQAKARYRAEVQRELIAKFSSGRELSEFLNSEGSRQLLGSVGSEGEDATQDPRRKIIGLITGGLINLGAGAALFYVGYSMDFWWFSLAGLITLGVGVSLLISAALSYYLSQKWGLDNPAGGDLPRSS